MWTTLRTLLVQRAESAEPASFVRVPEGSRFGPMRAEIRVGALVLGGGATSVVLSIWRFVGERIDKIRDIPVPTAGGALAQTVDMYGGDLAVTVASFPDGSDGSPVAITDVTDDEVTPIVVTSVGHGLITGDEVLIEGVLGNTAANGVWIITWLSANTFSLDGSLGNGDYISGGTWIKTSDVLGVSGAVEARSVDPRHLPFGKSLD